MARLGVAWISVFFYLKAYLVLLLHREVEGHFAGLSAHLSREEHLVLFGNLSADVR